MVNVTIPYTRRNRAKEFDENEKRWNVLVLHRRAGKSTHTINKLIKKCVTKPHNIFPDWVHAYIAPTYKQAKAIIREQTKYYSNFIPWIKVNEWELKIVFPNNHQMRLFGADNPDSLRGLKFRDVVFDEYAQQPSNIFTEIVRPALSDTKWWATWIWTPKGKNSFFDLYKVAENAMQNGKDYFCMIKPVSVTRLIDEMELLDAKNMMTQDEYDQEYECSRTASIKWAYYSKELNIAYEKQRVQKSLYDKLLPVYTFRDLGHSDSTAIVFTQQHGNEVRIIDSYQNNLQAIDHYFKVLNDKWYNYVKHYLPHDARAKSLQTWVSMQEQFEKVYPWKIEITKQLSVIDWINAWRLIFDKLRFDEENTEQLRQCLSNYRQERDDKRGVFKDNPLHDRSSHFADAFRYMAVSIKNITDWQRYNSWIITPDYSKYI